MLKEFKAFIAQGNVLDLAIGVVIGGAFGKIVSSFVDNILMPPIGFMLGGINLTEYKYILSEGTPKKNALGVEELVGEVAIKYGAALQSTIDFLLIAFFIFILLKAINKMQKKKEEVAAGPSNQEVLLTQIRDLLKEKK